MDNILKYGPEIYETAKAKGFWEDGQNRNKGEMVMLIITELAEAVEAHRKGKVFLPGDIPVEYLTILVDPTAGDYINIFQQFVKDTVEDEIADAVIRILDYCHGWEISLPQEPPLQAITTGNFSADVLGLCQGVYTAYAAENIDASEGYINWSDTLYAILSFCSWYNINLEQHVAWKLRYNQSRPHKHGKAY